MKPFARALLTLMLLYLISFPAFSEGAEDNSQLLYCIPSHSSIPQNQMDDFVVDFMLAREGSVRISLFQDAARGKALNVWTVKRSGNKATTFNWDGKLRGKLIEPGQYVLRFVTRDRYEETADIPLEVAEPRERLPLTATQPGDYLPDDMDIQSIWRAMMAPIAVADARDLYHEPLYDRPGGKKIGHVHGQTAGLIILDPDVDGYAKVGAWATEDGSYIEGFMKQARLKVVTPHARWGILIDKAAQKMYVYEADEGAPEGARLLGAMNISTGLMTRKKVFQETRAGAFITGERVGTFTSEGYRYDFAIRLDGGNLIHEMGYKLVNKQKDFSDQTPLLGSKASHGCVRVDILPGEAGLNAEWLWDRLPRNTKVLVLDDPDARMRRLEELGEAPALASAAQPGDTQLPGQLFLVKEDPAGQSPDEAMDVPEPGAGRIRLTMTFTGDCILGSEEKSRKKPESFDSFIAEKGYAWPFSGLYEIFSGDDLSIINLEGVLKDDTAGRQEGRLHWFRGPTDFVNILPAGHIEIAGLANNHMRDYGIAGHNSTRRALEGADIPYFGYGDLHMYEHQGIKIGFGGIRETIWRQKPGLPAEEIASLKESGCDYIVYTIHAGTEYERTHNELQEKMAHAIIDAGADLIIGMHPHVVQGIEAYKGGLIVYSLGNFTFGGNLSLTEFDGLVAQLIVDFEGHEARETTLRLIPVLTTGTAPDNDFRPVPAQGEDKERILTLVQDDSPELGIREVMRFRR